ncbi:MAG: tyrosine-type recombinase/integrase [Cellulomonas sp.]|nr:tyrosine-type recombinase/integrase [Cellulomonas sp.]
MTARTSHRRSSGAIRRLPSGRWQARYTGPDGAMRTIGTFAAKAEADQALAHEVSMMARGGWRDPRLGEQPLGEWFRGWIATRTDIAESTHALYEQVLATWIDAPIPVTTTSGRPRAIHLGIRTLASLTPAVVREWNHAVTTESTRRVTERWERSTKHDTRVKAAIRAWAAASGAPLAATGQTAATQAYRLLHAGMAQAVADELIAANPCAIRGAGQRDAHDRTDRRTVSLEEMWALADGMPERYRASVILAVCGGLRAGELFTLQRKHIDLAAGVVRVEQSLARRRTGQGWFSAPKTRAGKRAVVLPKIAIAALREHMTRFTPPGREVLIFGTQNGTPLSSGSRSTMFAKARSAIGRDDLT